MKKRVLPMLLLILPYLYLTALLCIRDLNGRIYYGFFSILWILLFLVFFYINKTHICYEVLHGEKSKYFLFWNMILKLCHIPIYFFVFITGIAFAVVPGLIILIPLLIAFDYMLLVLTTLYGIAGINKAQREGFFSTTYAKNLRASHFILCTDVVYSVITFNKIKSIRKNSDNCN